MGAKIVTCNMKLVTSCELQEMLSISYNACDDEQILQFKVPAVLVFFDATLPFTVAVQSQYLSSGSCFESSNLILT